MKSSNKYNARASQLSLTLEHATDYRVFSRLASAASTMILVAVGTSFALDQAEVELLELPKIGEDVLTTLPKNLARWHMDVTATYIDENGQQEEIAINNSEQTGIGALLSDDETLSHNFKKGTHSLILNFPSDLPLNRLFLRSYSAKGSVDIAVSDIPNLLPLDSRRWINAGDNIPLTPRENMNFTFPVIQALFIKLTFNIEEEGEIASLGLFGGANISQAFFKKENSDSAEGAIPDSPESYSYDFASLYTGTEIAYINSGTLVDANLMIDDDSLTYYEFSPEDNQSILVLDLKQEALVNKVSLLYETGPGQLEFYVLPTLDGIVKKIDKSTNSSSQVISSAEEDEEKTDADQMPTLASFFQPVLEGGGGNGFNRVRLPESFFEDNEPITKHKVTAHEDRFRIDFDQLSGQYLLIRWIPADPDSDEYAALGDDFSGHQGLKIYEISLFGDLPANKAILDYTGIVELSSSGDVAAATLTPVQSTPQIPPASL